MPFSLSELGISTRPLQPRRLVNPQAHPVLLNAGAPTPVSAVFIDPKRAVQQPFMVDPQVRISLCR